MEKLKAIFFDMDNVLILNKMSTGEYYWSRDLEKDLGINAQYLQKTLFSKEMVGIWNEVRKGLRDIKEPLEIFINQNDYQLSAEDLWNYILEKDSNVDERVLNFVKAIRAKNYKTYIATHQERERTAYVWNKLKFKNYFDDFFIVEKVDRYCKRDPEFFKIIQKRIGFKPCEMMLIDDKKQHIEIAKSAGWQGYHYTDFDKASEELFNKLI